MNGMVREQWGYEGFIVSDQGAIFDFWNGHHFSPDGVHAVSTAIKAGCDQNDGPFYAEYGHDAYQQGLLNESLLDQALTRILTQRFRVGAFDPPSTSPWADYDETTLDSHSHRESALRAARESMVLLNNSAGVLPLSPGELKSIAVIGPLADDTQVGERHALVSLSCPVPRPLLILEMS